MAGIDWLAVVALIISAIVALSQLSKEWRERKALSAVQKNAQKAAENEQALLPIRGANEAVLALQNALKVAYENEEKLRSRVTHLEKENDMKDEIINNLEHRIWYCERELKLIKGENVDGGG